MFFRPPDRRTKLSVPLRFVLVVPLILQILVTVGLISYLSVRSGQQAVNDLVDQLMSEVSDRTAQHLKAYTHQPEAIAQLITDDFELGKIDLAPKNLQGLDAYFLKRVQTFDSVSFIYVGDENGKFIGAGPVRRGNPSYLIEVSDGTTGGAYVSYPVDERGDRLAKIHAVPSYDPRRRPWYQAAIRAGKTTWSEIYPFISEANTGLTVTAVKPFFNRSNQLAGVAAVDLFLNDISVFLSGLSIARSGKVFILEPNGALVASSSDQPNYRLSNGNIGRVFASKSSDSLLQATAQHLEAVSGSFNQIRRSQRSTFILNNQREFVQVTPWRNASGLDWLIVAVVPEADFMEQINLNKRVTLLIGAAASIVAVVISWITARWVISPIFQLNQTAKSIVKGEWQAPIAVDRADEVGELAQAFNDMAQQLQTSFAEMHNLNQELADSKQRLSRILETLPIGVSVLNADGTPLYINQMGRALLGLGVIQNLPFEQISEAYQIYQTGSDRLYPTERLPLVQALAGRTVSLSDIEIRRAGEVLSLEATATPLWDQQERVEYAIATFQDIGERKRAEVALQVSEARLKAVLENVAVLITSVRVFDDADPEGNRVWEFEYLSPRSESIIGFAPADFLAQPNLWLSRMLPEDCESAFGEVLSEGISEAEYRFQHQNGDWLWLRQTLISRRDRSANCWLITGVTSDITEAKRDQVSRQQTEQLLADYRRTLEQHGHLRTRELQQEIAERRKIEAALRQANLALERLASLDDLTQVANRRRFDECLVREWGQAVRRRESLALILCDVDCFKSYNDRYGHQSGDECLRQVAKTMSQVVKRPTDLVARYGGEEFVVILPNTVMQGAVMVAEAIRQEVQSLQILHAGSQVSDYITLSSGIAHITPQPGMLPEMLVAAADKALYEAKKQGRDRSIAIAL